MQDITESLRIMAENLKWTSGKHTADLLKDAANEIEKLREELKKSKEPLFGNRYHGV